MINPELNKMLKNFTDNGISHESTRLNEVLDFQDIIGRMNYNDIFDNYSAMDKSERGTFLWASCSCLDKDMFLEIVKKVVCESIIHENEEYTEKIYHEKFVAIGRREENMNNLEITNAVNVERIRCLELELSIASYDIEKLTKKARSFDTIKSLLK